MQLGGRFAEYGLTGAFFWLLQLFLFWRSNAAQELLAATLRDAPLTQLGESKVIEALVTSLATAVAIIAVFVAGLLLDLMASYFLPLEMGVFKAHLDRNDGWLQGLLAEHGSYIGTDYSELRTKFGDPSLARSLIRGFGGLVFWRSERRRAYWASVQQGWGRWRLVRRYERLWSFFASYVVVLSGSSQLSLMVDQYYLWRTGRAISTALLLVFMQSQFSGLWLSVSGSAPFLGLAIPLAAMAVAFSITLATYSRLCFTVFSLVYVTHARIHGNPPDGTPGTASLDGAGDGV